VGRLAEGHAVTALVGGRHVALFCIGAAGRRLAEAELDAHPALHALDARDPIDRSGQLARGTVHHDTDGRLWVTSPSGPRRFDLRTGDCLDDPACRVQVWPVRTRRGMVEIAPPSWASGVPH
jgi:nitrite reductase (NADH) small subunit